jgi:PAS domain S-box-containing protein
MSAATRVTPSGRVRSFGTEEIIVSKTDLTGKITYANDVFIRVSRYSEAELLGAPHSLIRHPDMPRAVFKALWDTIEAGHEIFAYVKNMAADGDAYWVFAHVTPSYNGAGELVGYHSNRRCPDQRAIAKVEPIYAALREIERAAADRPDGLIASTEALTRTLAATGMTYHEWIWTL